MTATPRGIRALRDRMADQQRNRRWWVQVAHCGAWRFFPTWYEHEAADYWCPRHGRDCLTDGGIIDFRAANRPPPGGPLTGAGITEGNIT